MKRESLIEFMRGELGLDDEDLDDDTPIFSQGLLDSFSLVELVAFLESKAGIRVGAMDVNLENLDTVGRIMRFVEAKGRVA